MDVVLVSLPPGECMEARISMITLGVTDLKRSVQFYEAGLKFPKHQASEESVAFFNLQGTWLGLYNRTALAEDAQVPDDDTGFPGFTLAHNVSSKEQVDALVEEALAAGATLSKAPQDVFWGGYSGYVKDPDNYLWEIAYNPFTWIGPAETASEKTT